MMNIYIPIAVVAIIFGYIILKNIGKKGAKNSAEPFNDNKGRGGFFKRMINIGKRPAPYKTEKPEQVEGDSLKEKVADVGNKSVYPAVKARILNKMRMSTYFDIISGEDISGIIKKYGTLGGSHTEADGERYYRFFLDNNGLRPYFAPLPQNTKELSGGYYLAQMHPYIPFIVKLKDKKPFLQKYGMYLLFAGVVLFMMWSSSMN